MEETEIDNRLQAWVKSKETTDFTPRPLIQLMGKKKATTWQGSGWSRVLMAVPGFT